MVHVFDIIPIGAFVGSVIMLVLYVAIMAFLIIYTLLHSRLFARSSLPPDCLDEYHRQLGSTVAIFPSGDVVGSRLLSEC